MKKRLALLFLSALMAGCIPWPHVNQIAPAVTGVVVKNGQPVQGALVYWHPRYPPNADACSASEVATKTNEEGRFQLREERDFEMFVMMGDPIMSWTICIELEGVMYTGWREFSMGYAPVKVSITCDLSAAATQSNGDSGLCHIDAEQSIQPNDSTAASRRQSRG